MNQCANHYQVAVYCDEKWSGSIPAWDKKNKKQSCRCPDGTEWNKQLNRCARNIQEICGDGIDNNWNNQIDEDCNYNKIGCRAIEGVDLQNSERARLKLQAFCESLDRAKCEAEPYCSW